MPIYTTQQVQDYINSLGGGSEKDYLQAHIGEIAPVAEAGKFVDFPEIKGLAMNAAMGAGNNLAFYQNRATSPYGSQAQARLQSNLGNLDWAYKTSGGAGSLSRDFILRNMGLSSEQVGSQAEQNWEIDEIQKAYATKYGSAPAPTPTPLGEVSNQPSSGQQVGVTTGGVALYGTIPQVQSLSAPAPIYKSLIDIANSRPDVLNTAKAQGGDPFTAGTKANTWLNDWWNSAGKNEYPDTQLQTITPESLKNEKGIDLSGTGTTTKIVTPKVTIVSAGETIKSIDDYIKESTPTKSAADLEVEKWTKQAQEALGQEAGKSAMLTSELEKEGATDITKNLKDTQSKIKIKTAELQQMIADEESKPVTMRSMQGTIYQKSKVIQSDIMFLQATASALQGDLTFAQQQAQASVDAKYGPIEESLAIAQAQLKLLEPLLTKEEKIIAAARTQMYNDQQQAVADAKTLENNINNIILTAAKNAAPQDVLNAIAGTTSVTDAIQAAGTWLQEKTGADQWSEPYNLGGDLVQKNLNTGEIRTAVNVAAGGDKETWTDVLDANGKLIGQRSSSGKYQSISGVSAGTGEERAAAALAGFSEAFVPGAKYEGIDIIGADGLIDPRVWNAAIADAPSQGLSRKQFIEQFGYLINLEKGNKEEYGLTATEIKLITGEL
jgi:hypothetical protein